MGRGNSKRFGAALPLHALAAPKIFRASLQAVLQALVTPPLEVQAQAEVIQFHAVPLRRSIFQQYPRNLIVVEVVGSALGFRKFAGVGQDCYVDEPSFGKFLCGPSRSTTAAELVQSLANLLRDLELTETQAHRATLVTFAFTQLCFYTPLHWAMEASMSTFTTRLGIDLARLRALQDLRLLPFHS
eukprot:s6836_g2.t1